MILSTLRQRVLTRCGDAASPAYYSAAQATAAINSSQRLFVLLTLCLEKRGNVTISADSNFNHLLPQLADFLLPLRVEVSGGARLDPARIDDFIAMDGRWSEDSDDALYYAVLGFDLFATHPTPDAETVYQVTYAYAPTDLSADGDTPAIPAEYHQALEDGAIWILRMCEGGQEFISAGENLQVFWGEASRCADYVRARSMAAGYDHIPPEIKLSDLSRLLR